MGIRSNWHLTRCELRNGEVFLKTTRARFPADMARINPWAELAAAIEPVHPKRSRSGNSTHA